MSAAPAPLPRLVAEALAAWEPYVPPWYPAELAREHNPFTTDPSTYQEGHRTFYSVWMDSLPNGELVRLIAESRAMASSGAPR